MTPDLAYWSQPVYNEPPLEVSQGFAKGPTTPPVGPFAYSGARWLTRDTPSIRARRLVRDEVHPRDEEKRSRDSAVGSPGEA